MCETTWCLQQCQECNSLYCDEHAAAKIGYTDEGGDYVEPTDAEHYGCGRLSTRWISNPLRLVREYEQDRGHPTAKKGPASVAFGM